MDIFLRSVKGFADYHSVIANVKCFVNLDIQGEEHTDITLLSNSLTPLKKA